MTEREQRIAIAEFCGWENIREVGTFSGPTVLAGYVPGLVQEIIKELPDYPHDLNAMHEAEKNLSVVQFCDFCATLKGDKGDHQAIHATAAQRAEALLRTIGKWKD